MNRAFKVALIAIVSSLIFAAILTPVFGGGGYEVFMMILGLICLIGGVVLAFTALLVHSSGSKDWAKPILMASAICLVVGTGVCGSLMIGM